MTRLNELIGRKELENRYKLGDRAVQCIKLLVVTIWKLEKVDFLQTKGSMKPMCKCRQKENWNGHGEGIATAKTVLEKRRQTKPQELKGINHKRREDLNRRNKESLKNNSKNLPVKEQDNSQNTNKCAFMWLYAANKHLAQITIAKFIVWNKKRLAARLHSNVAHENLQIKT